MIKKRFFIEGNEIDLGDGINFPLNLQCSDVASLENIINNFTYSIKLPKTETNLLIIQQIQEVSINSEYQCTYHDCTYLVDEIPMFTNGRVRILRITDSIEITVLFGNFTMFETLKLKKLRDGNNDITMSDVLLWDYGLNENSSGYSGFALGQFGNTIDSIHNLYPSRVLPWVSAMFLWDMCLNSNYVLSTDVYDYLNKLVLPLTGLNSEKAYLDDVIVDLRASSCLIIPYPTGYAAFTSNEWLYSYDVHSDYYRLDFVNGGQRYFIAPIDGYYLITFEYSFSVVNADTYLYPESIIGIHRSDDNSLVGKLEIANNYGATENSIKTVVGTVKLDSNHVYWIGFSGSGQAMYGGDLSFVNPRFTIQLDPSNENNKLDTTDFKLKYPVNNNLPDVTQSDYVKSIMQLFGLMVQIIDNKYYFFNFSDVSKNIDKLVDWSDSLVQDSRHGTYVDFASDIGMDLAQANYLRYKADDDITDQYGDSFMYSLNQFIMQRDIFINQVFSASHMTSFLDQSNDTFNIITADLFKADNNNHWMPYKKINQRICILDNKGIDLNMKSIYGEPVVDNDGNPIDSVFSRNIYKFLNGANGLDYGSLSTNFWGKYTDIMSNYKQVRFKFILTPLQIKEFRFDYPIYLKQFGRYFFVKKINNWDVNKITEIDLIVL